MQNRRFPSLRGTVDRMLRSDAQAADDEPHVEGAPPEADRAAYHKAQSLDEFWELAHSSSASWWTSGTSFDYVRRVLALPEDLHGIRALVVGVGQGQEL